MAIPIAQGHIEIVSKHYFKDMDCPVSCVGQGDVRAVELECPLIVMAARDSVCLKPRRAQM